MIDPVLSVSFSPFFLDSSFHLNRDRPGTDNRASTEKKRVKKGAQRSRYLSHDTTRTEVSFPLDIDLSIGVMATIHPIYPNDFAGTLPPPEECPSQFGY